jgi:hypothetical protein
MKPLPPRQQNALGTNLALLKKAFEHEQFPIWSQAETVMQLMLLRRQFDFVEFQLG